MKTMPFGDKWDEYCRQCGVKFDREWFDEVKNKKKKFLVKDKLAYYMRWKSINQFKEKAVVNVWLLVDAFCVINYFGFKIGTENTGINQRMIDDLRERLN